MKTVKIFCAQKITDSQEVETVTIEIAEPIPSIRDYQSAHAQFRNESVILAEALINALPGGTLDQLLARLLEYKASLFVVRHADEKAVIE